VEQLAEWLDAINRPTLDDKGRRDRAIAEMRSAGVDNVFPLLMDRLKEELKGTGVILMTPVPFNSSQRLTSRRGR
jgi:hypothetical protein